MGYSQNTNSETLSETINLMDIKNDAYKHDNLKDKLTQDMKNSVNAENKNCEICCKHMKNGVILEPFMHQVGGHNIFLKYKPNSLCKVYHQDEYLFYKLMSPYMKDFIPKLNGIN